MGFVFLLSLEFWGNPYFLSFRLKVEEGSCVVFYFYFLRGLIYWVCHQSATFNL